MSFATTNSAVWKQIADEKEQSARLMARLAIGSLIFSAVLAGTAFSAHSNYSSMCTYVGERHAIEDAGIEGNALTGELLKDYCS